MTLVFFFFYLVRFFLFLSLRLWKGNAVFCVIVYLSVTVWISNPTDGGIRFFSSSSSFFVVYVQFFFFFHRRRRIVIHLRVLLLCHHQHNRVLILLILYIFMYTHTDFILYRHRLEMRVFYFVGGG